MSEQEFNKIFSQRLRYYLEKNNMTQKELADKLGVGTTSVYNWCNGVKSPRMTKVDKMCEIFGCTRVDLIQSESPAEYYLNPKAAAIAQQIYQDKDRAFLFELLPDLTPEQVKLLSSLAQSWQSKDDE